MTKAVVLFVALACLSGCLAIAGVYLLAGAGWTLLAGSLAVGAAAALVRRGLIANG